MEILNKDKLTVIRVQDDEFEDKINKGLKQRYTLSRMNYTQYEKQYIR